MHCRYEVAVLTHCAIPPCRASNAVCRSCYFSTLRLSARVDAANGAYVMSSVRCCLQVLLLQFDALEEILETDRAQLSRLVRMQPYMLTAPLRQVSTDMKTHTRTQHHTQPRRRCPFARTFSLHADIVSILILRALLFIVHTHTHTHTRYAAALLRAPSHGPFFHKAQLTLLLR